MAYTDTCTIIGQSACSAGVIHKTLKRTAAHMPSLRLTVTVIDDLVEFGLADKLRISIARFLSMYSEHDIVLMTVRETLFPGHNLSAIADHDSDLRVFQQCMEHGLVLILWEPMLPPDLNWDGSEIGWQTVATAEN